MPINDEKPTIAPPKIGELFVEAGVLPPKVVSDCLFTASHAQVPVGKVFILSGHVTAPDVECAVQTQKLLRTGKVTRQSAVRLLRKVHCNKISIEEAQSLEHCERAFSMPFSQIGKLLLAANIVSEQLLLTASARSTQEVPLGKLLVGEDIISQGLLIAVMNCLIFIRDKKISRHQAAKVLQTASTSTNCDLVAALKQHKLERLIGTETPKLLDLLKNAGSLTNDDADWSLEIAVETGRQTGQVLLMYNLINDNVLESALELQQMLAAGTLNLPRAAELLALCQQTESTLESVIAELNNMNQAVEFLRRGNFLDEREILRIAITVPDFDSHCGAILVREGVVTHEMLMEAMRCLTQVREGNVSDEQAFEAYRANMGIEAGAEESAVEHVNWEHGNRHANDAARFYKTA